MKSDSCVCLHILLDILAGRKHPSGLSGDVLVDGTPLPADFKCRSGYVVQDDVVMGTLTVRENLEFSAALRLSNSPSSAERKQRVETLLSELGIEVVADCKVGTELIRGVSGGERKRTNIGMELSRNGKTIIFSIHQPRYSIFKLFDSLTLLADGQMIFHGPVQKALSYFSTNGEPHFFLVETRADVNKVVESQKGLRIVEQLAKQYSQSTFAKETTEELERIEQTQKEKGHKKHLPTLKSNSSTASSFFIQMSSLLKRTFLNLVRNPQASVAQLLVTLLLGLTMGAIFFDISDDAGGIQNRVGAMYFLMTIQCFGSLSAVDLFIQEKKIFVHEYISGYYHVLTYFISRLAADLFPMRTLPGISFSLITYWMMGFQPKVDNFFTYLLTIIMVAYAAISLALALSAGSSNAAEMLICFPWCPQLFSGLLVNLPSIMDSLRWIQYFSIPRYGMAVRYRCLVNDTSAPPRHTLLQSDPGMLPHGFLITKEWGSRRLCPNPIIC
uniref:ABC-type xenobiotic transporter n=1 Tax=Eptatretus burgeri TaxID=7764 RepID=A0A8C4N898_EPTBU